MSSLILKRPIVTERTTLLREGNRYVFEVDVNASKGQVREAVETVFRVEVLAVNTMNMKGKLRRRMGRQAGYQPDWKKAVVTVKKGQEIKYAEPKS